MGHYISKSKPEQTNVKPIGYIQNGPARPGARKHEPNDPGDYQRTSASPGGSKIEAPPGGYQLAASPGGPKTEVPPVISNHAYTQSSLDHARSLPGIVKEPNTNGHADHDVPGEGSDSDPTTSTDVKPKPLGKHGRRNCEDTASIGSRHIEPEVVYSQEMASDIIDGKILPGGVSSRPDAELKLDGRLMGAMAGDTENGAKTKTKKSPRKFKTKKRKSRIGQAPDGNQTQPDIDDLNSSTSPVYRNAWVGDNVKGSTDTNVDTANLQRLPREYKTENAYLKQEQEDLQLAVETSAEIARIASLKRRLKENQNENAYLRQENEDLKNRLSKIASERLSDNNPNIADLSDNNRPTKLSDRFSELYCNEWSNAYDSLEESQTRTSREIIAILLYMIETAFTMCKAKADEDLNNLRTAFREITRHENETQEMLSAIKYGKDQRKKRFKEFLPALTARSILETWLPDKSEWTEPVVAYVELSIELCWLMCIQDPPCILHSDCQEGHKFNKQLFKSFMTGGTTVDYLVWPVLFLNEGGPVLQKGIAQCKSKTQKVAGVGSTNEARASSSVVTNGNTNLGDTVPNDNNTSLYEHRKHGESDELETKPTDRRSSGLGLADLHNSFSSSNTGQGSSAARASTHGITTVPEQQKTSVYDNDTQGSDNSAGEGHDQRANGSSRDSGRGQKHTSKLSGVGDTSITPIPEQNENNVTGENIPPLDVLVTPRNQGSRSANSPSNRKSHDKLDRSKRPCSTDELQTPGRSNLSVTPRPVSFTAMSTPGTGSLVGRATSGLGSLIADDNDDNDVSETISGHQTDTARSSIPAW